VKNHQTSVELPGSPTLTDLQRAGFRDTAREEYITWDALENPLTAFSTGLANARGQAYSAWENFNAVNAQSSRRVAYLIINQAFNPEDIQSNSLCAIPSW